MSAGTEATSNGTALSPTRQVPMDREVLVIDPAVMVKKLLIAGALVSLGVVGTLTDNWGLRVLGTLLTGAMFAHGVELTHQFLHGTGFGFRWQKMNRLFGFLCGLPMLVSHSHYRALHLAHHKNLGTPENREFFDYGTIKGKHPLMLLLRSMSPHRFLTVARNIARSLIGQKLEGVNGKKNIEDIRVEYGLMLVALVAVAMATTQSDLALRVWIIPLLLVAEPIHFFLELPEHFGCDLSTRNVLRNTRTIKGSWFSFWFTNGNNFHVEHHLFPRVAIDKLPLVHKRLNEQIKFYNPDYLSFMRMVFEPLKEGAQALRMQDAATNSSVLTTVDLSRLERPTQTSIEVASKLGIQLTLFLVEVEGLAPEGGRGLPELLLKYIRDDELAECVQYGPSHFGLLLRLVIPSKLETYLLTRICEDLSAVAEAGVRVRVGTESVAADATHGVSAGQLIAGAQHALADVRPKSLVGAVATTRTAKHNFEAKARDRIPTRLNVILACLFGVSQLYYLVLHPLGLIPCPFLAGACVIVGVLISYPTWALIHEGIHDLLHPDRAVGTRLSRAMSIIHGSPFAVLRLGHLLHHKYNRVEDLAEAYDPRRTSWLRAAFHHYYTALAGRYWSEVLACGIVWLPEAARNWFVGAFMGENEMGERMRSGFAKKHTLREARFDGMLALGLYAVAFWLYRDNLLILIAALCGRAFLVSFLDDAYHYGTARNSAGAPEPARNHAMLMSWLVLNFNYHGVHHHHPGLAWTELPGMARREKVSFDGGFASSALRQLRGPIPLTELQTRREG